MTLIEVAVALPIALVGIGLFLQMLTAGSGLGRTGQEFWIASSAAQDTLEEMRNADYRDFFRLYNADPFDDLGGPGRAPGSAFTVPGFEPLPDDPDGIVGEVILPAINTGTEVAPVWELREDVANEELGMPRDLTGDLVDFLGGVPQADPLVLGEVTHVAGVVPHPIDARLSSRVRGRLSSSDQLVLTETIQALAALEDNEALPELIALLEHDSENVRVRAHEALKGLSGEPFSRDHVRWKSWYQGATSWWQSEGQREFQRATSGPAAQASRAIMVLSRQPLYRHEIAESLVQALERREPELVVMTCAALGRLGPSSRDWRKRLPRALSLSFAAAPATSR